MLPATDSSLHGARGQPTSQRRIGLGGLPRPWPRTGIPVSAVAAPERPQVVIADRPSVLPSRARDDDAKLAPVVSAQAGVLFEPQRVGPADLASSPVASTSGRDSPDDRPFIPGSTRRVRRAHPRSRSAASFYGEYCDMQATQRMVSKIWQRHMTSQPLNGTGTGTTGSTSCSVYGEQADGLAVPDSLAATAPPEDDSALESMMLFGEASPRAAASSAPTSDSGSADDGDSAAAAAATDLAAPRRRRVVLYLGPDFQVDMPPPLLSSAGGGGFDGDSSARESNGDRDATPDVTGGSVEVQGRSEVSCFWQLNERELLESRRAPRPRPVTGSRLSSAAEKWWSVRGGSGGGGGGGAGQSGGRSSSSGNGSLVGSRTVVAAAAAVAAPTEAAGAPTVGKGSSSAVDVAQRRWGSPPQRQRQGQGQVPGPRGPQAGVQEAAAGERGQPQKQNGKQSSCRGEETAAAAAPVNPASAAPAVPSASSTTPSADSAAPITAPRDPLQRRPPSRRPTGQAGDAQGTSGRGTRAGEASAAAAPGGEEWLRIRQRDLAEALMARRDDAAVTEIMQQLHALNRTGVTTINYTLQILGDLGHVHALTRLLTLQVATGLFNEHTYATAFIALARAGRMDLALGAFQEACRSSRDLGPVACSSLLHVAAAQQRNLRLAWKLFDAMQQHRMTLNRYAYNCMAHIASSVGAFEDVAMLYGMMKAEAAGMGLDNNTTTTTRTSNSNSNNNSNSSSNNTGLGGTAATATAATAATATAAATSAGPRPDCSPDAYTFSALVRAASGARRHDLLPALFNEMAAQQRAAERAAGRRIAPGEAECRVSTEVWGAFLSAASRSPQPDLALRFFDAGLVELGLVPNVQIYNTLLGVLGRTRPLSVVFQVYRDMLQGHHRPLLQRLSGPLGGPSQPAAAGGPPRPSSATPGGATPGGPTPVLAPVRGAGGHLAHANRRWAAAPPPCDPPSPSPSPISMPPASDPNSKTKTTATNSTASTLTDDATTTTTSSGSAASSPSSPSPSSPPPASYSGYPCLAPDIPHPALAPDHYTFNALLTAAAHHAADLPTLERIRGEVALRGVTLNAHVGTSLIHAYRRTLGLGSGGARAAAAAAAAAGAAGGGSRGAPAAAAPATATPVPAVMMKVVEDVVVGRAEEVMAQLVSSGAANAHAYTALAALYMAVQRPGEAVRCLREMRDAGLWPDPGCWRLLIETAGEAELWGLVPRLEEAMRRGQQQGQRGGGQRGAGAASGTDAVGAAAAAAAAAAGDGASKGTRETAVSSSTAVHAGGRGGDVRGRGLRN